MMQSQLSVTYIYQLIKFRKFGKAILYLKILNLFRSLAYIYFLNRFLTIFQLILLKELLRRLLSKQKGGGKKQ